MTIKDELARPFEQEDIEWRIQRAGMRNDKPWGIVVPYITSRAVMDRLDEVFGIDGWEDVYTFPTLNGDKLETVVICTIKCKFITIEKNFIVVEKTDGAPLTNIESIKGGISDAFKRAGVKWGIGRYLYRYNQTFWANFSADGEHSVKINDRFYKWDAPALPNLNKEGE